MILLRRSITWTASSAGFQGSALANFIVVAIGGHHGSGDGAIPAATAALNLSLRIVATRAGQLRLEAPSS